MAQLRVLIRLEPGLTVGSLAERLGVPASTITGVMDRLAHQNLVERAAT